MLSGYTEPIGAWTATPAVQASNIFKVANDNENKLNLYRPLGVVLTCLRMQPKAGGKLHLRLNTGMRLIADKYREGKLKRTLKREFKST